MQNLFVQEDQCIQRLGLGRCRYGFIDSEMIKKRFDMGLIQGGGMPFVVEEDVLPYPVSIALFGAGTVMTAADGQAQLLK